MAKTIRYDLRGHIRACAQAANGTIQKVFDWSNAIADAGIMAGVSGFATYGASLAVGTPGDQAVKAALIAGGSQFFVYLAIKRGLIKPEPTTPQTPTQKKEGS